MSYIIIDKLDTPSTTAEYAPGTVAQDSSGKIYKYVRFILGGGVAGAVGNVTYYAPSGYKDDFRVTSDVSSSTEVGAGVLMSAPANEEYCWVQIKGAAALNIALTAGVNGDPLTPTGAADGTLDVVSLVTDAVCAYVDDAGNNEIICDFPF